MKRVLIVTLHSVWNWGSVLQTYATQELFKKSGAEVTVADYIQGRFKRKSIYLSYPDRYQDDFLKKWLYRFVMLPMRVRLDYIFSKFLSKHVDLTNKKYYSSEQLKTLSGDYDVLVTGSDQVWNSSYNGCVDETLYLSFANDKNRCISYAASFGMRELPENEKSVTSDLLKKYKKISVRENDAVRIIAEMGFESICVLDPTLVLDRDYWKRFAGKRRIKEKYLLLYALHGCNGSALELVKEISKRLNLKVVCMNYGYKLLRNQQFDQYISPKSPEDFVSLIGNADFVVADSFHGTAFSINFHKNFLAVAPERFDSRLLSIVSILGIEDRIFSETMGISKALAPIDFDMVEAKLNEEREKSLKFIKEALYE